METVDMRTLTIGDTTYVPVDDVARTDVEALSEEVEGIKNDADGYLSRAENAANTAIDKASEAAKSADNAAASAETAMRNMGEAMSGANAAADSATAAQEAAELASQKASDAAASASTASSKASSASSSAATATNKANAAAASATAAEESRQAAATEASTASTKATEAASSASEAQSSAKSASDSATDAEQSASTASSRASAAATSASNAKASETNAASYASTAATKANAASTAATNAEKHRDDAAERAAEAMNYAQQAIDNTGVAVDKAAAAATSAVNAKTSETNAKTSETNAASSASTATSKASAAATSATNAANSASTATTKANAAATSATNAAKSANDAQAAAELVLNATPSYIIEEAERVAEAVLEKRTGKSLVFAAMSDIHHPISAAQTQQAIEDAGAAVLELRKHFDLDFVAMLGDFVSGGSTATIEESKTALKVVRRAVGHAFLGLDQFWTQGNHDRNPYDDTDDGDLSDDELYSYISSNTRGFVRDPDNTVRMYAYKDFDHLKIRVIGLNSSDSAKTDTKYNIMWSKAQLEWVVNVALDFSDKDDPSEWGIITLSHIPMNWTEMNVLPIFEAYASGAKGTAKSTVGESVPYDFTSGKRAEIICYVNGHTHNFRYSQVGTNKIWQIAVPQVCVGRYNEYGTSWPTVGGDLDADGNPVYYYKTPGTAEGTSFVVFVIDRDSRKIHALKYGAGVDRVMVWEGGSLGSYTVTYDLGESSSSTSVSEVGEGSSFSADIAANDGYGIKAITVTMGGQDVSSAAVSGSKVSITSVTGDVVIKVVTIKLSVTVNNLFSTSDADYSVGRLNSSGAVNTSYTNGFVSGFIAAAKGDVIRARSANTAFLNTYGVIAFYNSSKTYIGQIYINDAAGRLVMSDDGKEFMCDTSALASTFDATAYVRIMGYGSPDGFIITKNQEISDSGETPPSTGYTNLIDTIGYMDNTRLSTSAGNTKEATGYVTTGFIDMRNYSLPIVIRTKGVDFRASTHGDCARVQYTSAQAYHAADYLNVLDNASMKVEFDDYGNLTFTIKSFATANPYFRLAGYGSGANLILTVNEEITEGGATSYTNLVPTALDFDLDGVFNGIGYMNGKYLSASAPYYNTDANTVTTGLIPYVNYNTNVGGHLTPPTIYVKGVTIDTSNSHNRFGYAKEEDGSGAIKSTKNGASEWAKAWTITELGAKYYKLEPVMVGSENGLYKTLVFYMSHVAFSFTGTGENLIITLDEPIE